MRTCSVRHRQANFRGRNWPCARSYEKKAGADLEATANTAAWPHKNWICHAQQALLDATIAETAESAAKSARWSNDRTAKT